MDVHFYLIIAPVFFLLAPAAYAILAHRAACRRELETLEKLVRACQAYDAWFSDGRLTGPRS